MALLFMHCIRSGDATQPGGMTSAQELGISYGFSVSFRRNQEHTHHILDFCAIAFMSESFKKTPKHPKNNVLLGEFRKEMEDLFNPST